MNRAFLESLTPRYRALRIAVVGDYCLDRYLEINAARAETSLETGLPVYNVDHVRPQPGAAGTILNNLVALGVGTLYPVGFCGEDGEGFELKRALSKLPGVDMRHFLSSAERKTFTYTKPLILSATEPPRELNRLDTKNWTPTPDGVSDQISRSIAKVFPEVDALILMDQVDVGDTGVLTTRVLAQFPPTADRGAAPPVVIADSRRSLKTFPPCLFKMNGSELARLCGEPPGDDLASISRRAVDLSRKNGLPVVVTLAERGMLGALPTGATRHVPAYPVRGPIDIVGAGDAVTANVAAALAAGCDLPEALQLATLAASVVIHQLGTSGAASLGRMAELLQRS